MLLLVPNQPTFSLTKSYELFHPASPLAAVSGVATGIQLTPPSVVLAIPQTLFDGSPWKMPSVLVNM